MFESSEAIKDEIDTYDDLAMPVTKQPCAMYLADMFDSLVCLDDSTDGQTDA